ncbi:cytochrome P450 [Sphaerisporangium album]|uniref:cytochrome P450 n=1 Tax=Sphaerisporangium album TaxID=509200 RepID=UPI001C68C152|nr:cytochrome P450 [Sphaerisporangium album]
MTEYDPVDPAVQADPYPIYAYLRDNRPLYHNPKIGQSGAYVLSRYEDVTAAWADYERFSSSHGPTVELKSPQARRRSGFISMDPPEHTAMRALVSRGFTPRRVQELEPGIREIVRGHLERVRDLPTWDFIAYANKIPMDVISELLGVPHADREEIRRLSELSLSRDQAGQVPPAAQAAHLDLRSYYASLVSDRRRRPGPDLATALVEAQDSGNHLSDEDAVSVMLLLGIAGNESTVKLLGNVWYQGWKHPEQRRKAWKGQIAQWVEETLRYDSPGQMLARIVAKDVTLYGETVPAGSTLLLLPASANRDPRMFRDPDRYDLDRDTSGLTSFGRGPHFCLGASLARLEARVLLEETVEAIPQGYEIDEPAARRLLSPTFRGFTYLPTVNPSK